MNYPSQKVTSASHKQPALEIQHLELLTRLGHPHGQTSPQATEPFWQQAPEVAHPNAYYYPESDTYTLIPQYHAYLPTMTSGQVVIGFKSQYASPNAKTRDTPVKRPREIVKVYLDDEYVGEISLGVMVRFSKFAKSVFPKPPQANNEEPQSKVSDGSKVINKDAPANGDASSKSKSWADMVESEVEQTKESVPVEAVATASTAPHSTESPAAPELPEPKALNIGVDGAWVQPDISVARHILNWMEQNKRTRNNEPLLPLTPAPFSKITLRALVDTYTGVLAFDLAPFPRDLRHEILGRLTQYPAGAKQMQYLYEHLPVHDPIINRMVTSFFEHSEGGRYTQVQLNAIYAYVNDGAGDEGELAHHFERVRRNRIRKNKRENAMEKLREGFEDFAGPMRDALPDGGEEAAQGGKGHGRRRNRREQQAKGNAKGEASSEAKGKGN